MSEYRKIDAYDPDPYLRTARKHRLASGGSSVGGIDDEFGSLKNRSDRRIPTGIATIRRRLKSVPQGPTLPHSATASQIDTGIKEAVIRRLQWLASARSDLVDVQVEQCRVYLSGELESSQQRDDIVRSIRSLRSVVDVVDCLTVKRKLHRGNGAHAHHRARQSPWYFDETMNVVRKARDERLSGWFQHTM